MLLGFELNMPFKVWSYPCKHSEVNTKITQPGDLANMYKVETDHASWICVRGVKDTCKTIWAINGLRMCRGEIVHVSDRSLPYRCNDINRQRPYGRLQASDDKQDCGCPWMAQQEIPRSLFVLLQSSRDPDADGWQSYGCCRTTAMEVAGQNATRAAIQQTSGDLQWF